MTKSLAKAIALATVLGASASAHAINVNPDGLGEVLLYSMYTTEQGNDTNISITNTTDRVKAVKVRFLEGQNSQEVLDFNLYLSPYDQWSGAITQTANGAKLVTFDRSCTAPAIPANGVEFRDFAYKGDKGEQSLARSRVGHVEIIEMGEFDENYVITKPGAPGRNSKLVDLATHDHSLSGAQGTNADCNTLRAQFSGNGIWAGGVDGEMNEGFLGVDSTSQEQGLGGLYGYATIINVEKSTQISYDALAIDNFRGDSEGAAPIHANTGSTYPGLNDGRTTTAQFKNNTSASYANSYQAISAVLMKESISNEYVLDEGRMSETNWVITFPTKRFHVDNQDSLLDLSDALPPFVTPWGVPSGSTKASSCHTVGLKNWDNEEFEGTPADLDFSPSPVGESAALCYETNVLTFNGAKVLGGEFVSYNVNLDQPDFQFGWMNIAFTAHAGTAYELADVLGENEISGLPAVGFSAVTISNNIADNGVMNNYGSSITHKAKTSKDKVE